MRVPTNRRREMIREEPRLTDGEEDDEEAVFPEANMDSFIATTFDILPTRTIHLS